MIIKPIEFHAFHKQYKKINNPIKYKLQSLIFLKQ